MGVTDEPPEPVDPVVEDMIAVQVRLQPPFCGNIVMLNGVSIFPTVKTGRLINCKASLYEKNKAIEAKDLNERPL
jgi:hypothetical protein